MDIQTLEFINKQVLMGNKVAMIMLTDTSGSTPGKAGSIMAVSEDGTRCATVGGGALENQIILSAMEAIENGEDKEFSHDLTEKGKLGMVCGGAAKGYIKVFFPTDSLIIVGAGHIGKQLGNIASCLDFNTTVIDDRAEYANSENFPNANIIVGDYEEELKKLKTNSRTFIVIVTRGHKYDTVALKALLNKDSAYIGMIGSKKKVKGTLDLLSQDENYKESLEKLYAPIGLDIGSNKPKEIALSIMTEIVLVKNGKKPRFMKDIYREKMSSVENNI